MDAIILDAELDNLIYDEPEDLERMKVAALMRIARHLENLDYLLGEFMSGPELKEMLIEVMASR